MDLLRYIRDHWDTLQPQIVDHAVIVLTSVVAATVIGVSLGVIAARSRRLSGFILALSSVAITLPSFALFSVLTVWLGLGDLPTEVGLVIYALLPIVRNTTAGLGGVPAAVMDAAAGMGMNSRQRLFRVQLPLALPVMVAGVRQATVMIVAIATVGAAVGANDLGQPIFEGIRESSTNAVFSGIIPVALLALGADQLLGLVERLLGRNHLVAAA